MNENHSRLAREQVMTDLRTLAEDAETLLKATANDVSDIAKDARARLEATITNARSTCQRLQEESLESAKAAAKQVDETIRLHPYESIAVTFGIGLLLGALLRGK